MTASEARRAGTGPTLAAALAVLAIALGGCTVDVARRDAPPPAVAALPDPPAAAATATSPPPSVPPADANGDGVVTRQEWDDQTRALLDRYDADRNGRIEGDELGALRSAAGLPLSDADPDVVTSADLTQARSRIFGEHDRDRNGKLDGTEIDPLPLLILKF